MSFWTVPIDPPGNITISSPDASTLRIEWIPPSNTLHRTTPYNITGYIIFYRNIRGTSSLDYSRYATDGNTTTANLTGLTAGSTYIVRILSCTRDGNGVASRGIEIATLELCKSKLNWFLIYWLVYDTLKCRSNVVAKVLYWYSWFYSLLVSLKFDISPVFATYFFLIFILKTIFLYVIFFIFDVCSLLKFTDIEVEMLNN